jgi:hypothetical protein
MLLAEADCKFAGTLSVPLEIAIGKAFARR